MKIITSKQQKKIDAMMIKKFRFVALTTLENFIVIPVFNTQDRVKNKETRERVLRFAEQVFYSDIADEVI